MQRKIINNPNDMKNYKSNLNKFTNANQIQVGDVVVVNGPIQNYGGICETYRGFVEQSSNPNF